MTKNTIHIGRLYTPLPWLHTDVFLASVVKLMVNQHGVCFDSNSELNVCEWNDGDKIA